MAKAIFIFDGITTIIQCRNEEKMEDICQKFVKEIGVDINTIYFIYGGTKISNHLTFNEQANPLDKKRNEMNILVYQSRKTVILNEDNLMKISKRIICPLCLENCRIKFQNYKLLLYGCKNGHETNDILLDEFENTQKINELKIICDNCKNINKFKAFNRQFYKCLTCKQNLCPLCKSIHSKEHFIIDYEEKDYLCEIHNEIYISYCNKCNINLCMHCEKNHQDHKIINYKNIKINKEEIKQNLSQFRTKIDIFNNKIKDIINILNKIIDNIEIFYKINFDILNNYTLENYNYQILQNINDIKNNIKIEDINKIINNKDINYQFKYLVNIFSKITGKIISNSNSDENNNEVKNNITENKINILKEKKQDNKIIEFKGEAIIRYKINKNADNIVKIFGYDFIKNNIKNCIIINEKNSYKLCEYFDISNYPQNKDILEIKLKGINNIIDMSFMFADCEKLLSLSDISDWDSSKVNNMSFMFYNCSLLNSLPDISKWNTSNVTNMKCMFYNCSNLKSISSLSNWNINNVKNMSYMFYNCSSLSSLPDISKWNTKKIDMSEMFSYCGDDDNNFNSKRKKKKKKLVI